MLLSFNNCPSIITWLCSPQACNNNNNNNNNNFFDGIHNIGPLYIRGWARGWGGWWQKLNQRRHKGVNCSMFSKG